MRTTRFQGRPGSGPARRNVHIGGLVWTLIRTEFKTRYHGTLAGYLWALAKPLTMFVVLVGVFSFVFRTDPSYRLNLIIGLFLWDFFAESTRAGLGCLHAKGFLLTKAKLPRWVLVVTSSSNALVTLGLFSVVLLTYLGLSARLPGPGAVFLYLLYLAHYVVIVWGFSFAASVLFLRYRDLNQLWDLALQAGFFVAPVIYPLGILPERIHFFLYLWLPTPVIQFTRDVLVRGTTPTPTAHLLLAASAGLVLGTGWLIFQALAPWVVEEL